jgi:hypothetical protein
VTPGELSSWWLPSSIFSNEGNATYSETGANPLWRGVGKGRFTCSKKTSLVRNGSTRSVVRPRVTSHDSLLPRHRETSLFKAVAGAHPHHSTTRRLKPPLPPSLSPPIPSPTPRRRRRRRRHTCTNHRRFNKVAALPRALAYLGT